MYFLEDISLLIIFFIEYIYEKFNFYIIEVINLII